jgi:hypothetical protein
MRSQEQKFNVGDSHNIFTQYPSQGRGGAAASRVHLFCNLQSRIGDRLV